MPATLAACAGVPDAPRAPVTRAPVTPGAEAAAPLAAPAGAPTGGAVRVPGPSPARFVGAPLARLEALTGAPSLVRREGENEFRRYDLGADCRVYAVVRPAGGTVLSIDTGAAVQGRPEPAFEDCTMALAPTGR